MLDFELVPDRNAFSGFPGDALMRAFLETIKARPPAMQSNRNAGMALILLTERLGYSQAAAYRMVYPERRCSDESAARHVRNLKAHHRKTNPLSINEALEVNGVTIEGIIEDIQAEREATKFNWNNKTGKWEPSNVPDYATRRAARRELREWVNIDAKARQELAIGAAETKKMHLNTGMKFDTIQEWTDWMEGQDEKLLEERKNAAREMKQIAAGQRIIQKEGQELADEARRRAQEAGITGDEDDD